MSTSSLVRFMLHVGVLAVSIALVVWLTPGMSFESPSLVRFLALGLIFALINALLRPVLVILTGRLLIATMGLFLIVLNFVLFWLLYLLVPNFLIVDDPAWLRLLLASALIGLLAFALEAVLGLNRPDITIDGGAKGIWKLVDRLPTGRRNALLENIRLEQVYATLSAYGLDILIGRTPLVGIRRWVGEKLLRRQPGIDDLSTPAKVRIMLQQLGPTWVKLGQIASSQAGTMPAEWAEELAKLQNTVAPFPFAEAKQIVESELKRPLGELFQSFEETPFAAASTAQVHKAMLPNGCEVVVKVQRPNIVKQTAADLGVMEQVARALQKRVKAMRAFDLPSTVHEFATGVMDELDYTIEAYNAQRLADVVRGISRIHIVGVHPEYSTSRVLTMDFVSGVKVTNTQAMDESGVDRVAVAEAYIKALAKQLMLDGFFHGDPHPGNLIVDLKTSELTMLDCGLVGELTQAQRISLLDLMMSLQNKDVDGLAKVVLTFCVPTRRADYEAYDKGVRRLIYRFVVYSPFPNLSGFMSALLASLYEYGLKMDSNMSLAIKAILQAFEAALALDPKLTTGMLPVITNTATVLIREQITPERVGATVQKEALDVGREIVRRLPDLKQGAYKWMDNLTGGGVQLKLDTSELSKQVSEMDTVLRRVVVGLVLGGLIIGTAIVAVGLALATIGVAFFVNQSAISPGAASVLSTALPFVALGIFAVVAILSLIVVWRVARPPSSED